MAKAIDMFFPIGEEPHQDAQIIIPSTDISGEVYSPHVVSLQEQKMNIPCKIKITPNGDKTFAIKKIEHIEPKPLSLEEQVSKAKKVIDLTPTLSRIDTRSSTSPFFRNLGKMFSLFFVFLTGALFTSSLSSAISLQNTSEKVATSFITSTKENHKDIESISKEIILSSQLFDKASFFLPRSHQV